MIGANLNRTRTRTRVLAVGATFVLLVGAFCSLSPALHRLGNDRQLRKTIKPARLSRAELGIPDSAFVVTATGSLCHRKQQHWVVRALRALLAQGADAYALLVGKQHQWGVRTQRHVDEFVAQVSEEAQRTGLNQTRLRIIEFTPSGSWQYIALANLHVSASQAEAYPLNTLEAMALGVPVVATAAGGTAEQWPSPAQAPEVQWMLVGPTDEQGFVAAVSRAHALHTRGELLPLSLIQRAFVGRAEVAVRRFEQRVQGLLDLVLSRLPAQRDRGALWRLCSGAPDDVR
ncbi:hypothetical protein EMIHUDRAFT_202151 [Emiliania huxleyi CCMP1516]|uniref:Glycosyl transferase family 1 domain-containing protein n=2 Tax=Emiliania huxleyi TaxID=2903 RepID=A0A0D3KF43_EMIH1|nr:hypothetical protein EMIHUDRAFT_202151 [Emiliania huxleyi CCMP1516]EOD34378.1 hypothetical protein EMIHUDRAFT_202151 [Emiliania huxleyi CCMP1516]|eukprot:XP_005786807.1 hypothetical protein EMIHUDRAFT_202151 [Emiliania huxleyi CCMP1516]